MSRVQSLNCAKNALADLIQLRGGNHRQIILFCGVCYAASIMNWATKACVSNSCPRLHNTMQKMKTVKAVVIFAPMRCKQALRSMLSESQYCRIKNEPLSCSNNRLSRPYPD
jgi:hypothetical protein